MKIKNILAVLLCLAMAVGALASCGGEDKLTTSAGLTFSLNEDKQSYTCTGLGACIDTDLVIDTYKGLPVTAVKSNAFFGCKNLTSVTLGDSVTDIGEWSFHGCTKLTSVSLGKNVTTIGFGAFDNCYRLAEVVNNSALEITVGSQDHGYIALHALEVHGGDSKISEQDGFVFYPLNGVQYLLTYTGKDTAVTLPDSYLGGTYVIRRYAFSGSDSLNTVKLGNGVTSIGESAFSGCPNLILVSLGDKVASIDDYAFFGCTALQAVPMSNSVTSIGACAFQNCQTLTSITLPQSLTSLGQKAFFGCNALNAVYFTGSSDAWTALAENLDTGIPASAEIHFDHQP